MHGIILISLSLAALLGSASAPYLSAHPLAQTIHAARTGKISLVINNSSDYIADGSDGSMDIVSAFEKYCFENDGVAVDVSYSTFSAMEDELSALQQGTKHVDLACVSDYIIQKLMTLNLVVPFASGNDRATLYGEHSQGWEDYYAEYASQFLQNQLASIHATINGKDGTLGEYARGYMWGTLGLTYNPNFAAYQVRGLSEGDVMVQMNDWNALWSGNYNQTFQFKDSMRDTYSIGLMHVFDGYFKTLLSWFEAGKDNGGAAYDESAYNADVSTIFNNLNHLDEFNALVQKIAPGDPTYTLQEIIDQVQSALATLKETSFGLEVDSGKTDIVSGDKSGIDTAWSGDAITSMNGGDARKEPVTLYYSIPKSGGNIWFDAWVLIKSDSLEQEYAQKFIDFISKPDIASANMDYIGYTSFIAGGDILGLVREWYDPRTSAMYALDEDGYILYDYSTSEDGEAIFLDGTGVHDLTYKNSDGEEVTLKDFDFGSVDMRGSNYEAPTIAGVAAADWSSYAKENDWKEVDLSYFFKGSLDSSFVSSDMLFYTNELVEATGKNLQGVEETVLVGRQFLAQYPTEDATQKGTVLCQIPGLAVMEDYKNNNSLILFMWENVKSGGTIQPWIIVLLSVEVLAALSLTLYLFFKSHAAKILRRRRRAERQGAK